MNRQPPIPLDDALERLLKQAVPLADIEAVPTLAADRRVLATDVVSTLDVPAWDNAQMDGYAVRAAEVARRPGTVFEVSQRIPAGNQGGPLAVGSVARIFTGAALPAGADAVVMQEEAEDSAASDGTGGREGKPPVRVRFAHAPTVGQWVRRTGEDIRRGAVILAAGTTLTPQATGLAASVGVTELKVRRPVRVACFFTGDELAMPGEALRPGAIYNSNRFLLTAMLRRLGCEVTDFGIVGDSLAATRSALRTAAGSADLIVTCGGMSVGEEDHVKPAVEAEGTLDMWQIAIKPGKPLAYGTVRRSRTSNESAAFAHFIGLPGNPVASFVTFLLFVRPFVLRLQGVSRVKPMAFSLVADFDWPKPDRRREFLRASVDETTGRLTLFPNQGSAVLTSTVVGDGLIDNPAGHAIRRGDAVRFLPFAGLLN